jgi:oligopeptide/dipeptide ABC transporter ATP-binding protein
MIDNNNQQDVKTMTKRPVLLDVKNLRTHFHTFRGLVKAVDGISFQVNKGEIVGIVGESGSGKSVTSFSIMGLIESPGVVEADYIYFDENDIHKYSESQMMKVRGKEISMVFQDPMTSLNPLYTIKEQMEEMLILHAPHLSATQRHDRCVELLYQVRMSNPEEALKMYPHQFSGGMRQRVIVAISMAADPKLIIADEPTTALDVTIQAQVLHLMYELVRKKDMSLMLITHDLAVVSQLADRIVVMYSGKIMEQGSRDQIIQNPLHPYTVGLLECIPRMNIDKERLYQIPGNVPNMLQLPKGCKFSTRCRYCQELCVEVDPEPRELRSRQMVACHFPLWNKEENL